MKSALGTGVWSNHSCTNRALLSVPFLQSAVEIKLSVQFS